MPTDEKQRKLFAYLQQALNQHSLFTLGELQKATGWDDKSFRTYRSKQFGSLIGQTADGRFRVTDTFRRYASWDQFQDLVSQVRRTNSAKYELHTHDNPVVFEFFLPLANEVHLREALDALFYRESVSSRLRTKNIAELRSKWPGTLTDDDAYINELCDWLGSKLAGYSIGQVNGRYRAAALQTQAESAVLAQSGGKYIIDEITAVVRFILPVGKAEVDAMEFFFDLLFVQAVLEVTDKEAEIWMLESGSRSNLRIWSLVE